MQKQPLDTSHLGTPRAHRLYKRLTLLSEGIRAAHACPIQLKRELMKRFLIAGALMFAASGASAGELEIGLSEDSAERYMIKDDYVGVNRADGSRYTTIYEYSGDGRKTYIAGVTGCKQGY